MRDARHPTSPAAYLEIKWAVKWRTMKPGNEAKWRLLGTLSEGITLVWAAKGTPRRRSKSLNATRPKALNSPRTILRSRPESPKGGTEASLRSYTAGRGLRGNNPPEGGVNSSPTPPSAEGFPFHVPFSITCCCPMSSKVFL